MKSIFAFVLLATVFAVPGFAANNPSKASQLSLEDQLKTLDTGNQLPASANHDKMYSVQPRYLPLQYRSEISFGAAQDMTPDSFLKTQQLELEYRFHFNDRWSVGLAQAWVDNQLKGETTNIQGALPAVPYATMRQDLTVEYNIFYGKFRWGSETVSYFDMYGALGTGRITQVTGNSTDNVNATVADVGFAFWLGKWGSARLGIKDYAYNETYLSGTLTQHNIHAHVDLGYIF